MADSILEEPVLESEGVYTAGLPTPPQARPGGPDFLIDSQKTVLISVVAALDEAAGFLLARGQESG
jgi:hypothetical protein